MHRHLCDFHNPYQLINWNYTTENTNLSFESVNLTHFFLCVQGKKSRYRATMANGQTADMPRNVNFVIIKRTAILSAAYHC